MVVAEAGFRNIVFYSFDNLDKASKFFDSLFCSRILYDTSQNEIKTGKSLVF